MIHVCSLHRGPWGLLAFLGCFVSFPLHLYFVRTGFGFRTEISDADPSLLLLCRSLLLLPRWEWTWCCWRGLWLTRHVFGIESCELRATYVLLLFWRVGLLRETNLRYNRANPPASGEGWWVLHACGFLVGQEGASKFEYDMETWWSDDIRTALGDDRQHCALYSKAMRSGLQSEG